MNLRHAVRFNYGDALASDDRDEFGEILVYGSNGPVGVHKEANTRGPAILIGRKGSFGKITWADHPSFAIDTTYFVDETTTENHLRFVFYALQSLRLDSVSKDTGVPGLSREDAYEQRLAVPPLTEQRIIAAYLDRETGRIDALVERLERLIALLTEKRQAVISRAVTKGLDPSAPMKDSGIAWLGEVPAHWEERRLYTFARFVQGKAHEPFFDPDGDFACATARFVSTGGEVNRYSTENLTPAAPGDILMVMSDLPNGRALARAYLTKPDDRIAINQRVAGITVVEGSPAFLAFQLDRHPELLAYNDGSNQTHLKNSYFTQLVLRFPPVAEQEEIAVFLRDATDEIDRLRLRAEAVIEITTERRAALISAAVTGQIPLSEMEAA